ncbi:MAG TPA: ATP-grasp domain-containing protein [Mariniphaga anaerophila]|uniref:ATP-grasp domain-containing protein n=1 Tax=Mariniphaga anaerophila TaxID=1484053 RepID=A0A831PKI1_9BACT|nr:ATP-grasp domain-containing protein [Mariniphaga anaerophila]
MNILLSTIGRRGYIADFFRKAGAAKIIGTTDRHGADTEFTVGLLSCDKKIILPPISSPDYINSLLELCKKEQVNLLCSLFDQDSYTISKNLDEFRNIGVIPLLPSEKANEICFDKVKTVQFLNKIGLGSPATFTTIESFNKSDIGFPVVVKPRNGFASLNMFFAKKEIELTGCFDSELHIIQEKLSGIEFSFDILNDLHGKVISCVVKQKIKMRAGETDQAITVKDDNLLEIAIRVGESMGDIGLCGPLDVDLFVTENQTYILEFNPRFGGGYPLSHAAGAKFPELMLDMAKGITPKSIVGQYQENLVMMKDVRAITISLDSISHDIKKFGTRANG